MATTHNGQPSNLFARDLTGYGEHPPQANWPNQARIAVQFVINYEEGAEHSILNGDAHSETFLSEIIGAEKFYQRRHLSMESIYEYGARAGFWRLRRLFDEFQIPVTVFAVAMALEKNPIVIEAMQQSGWEIASHGLRWIDYKDHSYEQEAADIDRAIETHTRLTGEKPRGFYQGRTGEHTLRILADRGDMLYSADSYSDDLPYWDRHHTNAQQRPLLMVPYTLDVNDMRFASAQGFNSGEQFFHYLKDSFDCLYHEGAKTPKMLSVGLHCRLCGRPGRIMALRRFIDYITQHDSVWLTTREAIAEHWQANHPYQSS